MRIAKTCLSKRALPVLLSIAVLMSVFSTLGFSAAPLTAAGPQDAIITGTAITTQSLSIEESGTPKKIHIPQEYETYILDEEDGHRPSYSPGQEVSYALGDTKTFSFPSGRGFYDKSASSYHMQTNGTIQGEVVYEAGNVRVWVPNHLWVHDKFSISCPGELSCTYLQAQGQAQRIGQDFQSVYDEMTGTLGSHAGVGVLHPSQGHIGDKQSDGKVNILLYNIYQSGMNLNGNSYIGGFFYSADMYDGGNGMDLLHIHIGNKQLDSVNREGLNNTLAHEFQHMLFYMYFGVYTTIGWSGSLYDGNNGAPNGRAYTWINEGLAELAGVYYSTPGAEIDDGRLKQSAPNSYADNAGYGDLFNFNGSFKNYGMGSMFTRTFDKKYDGFLGGIYAQMKTTFPPANNEDAFLQNMAKLGTADPTSTNTIKTTFRHNYTDHDKNVGNFIWNGTGRALGTGGRNTLELAYAIFMENFAADGGLITTTTPGGTGKGVKMVNDTGTASNLWYQRAALGLGVSASPIAVAMQGYDRENLQYNVNQDEWYKPFGPGATHEMIYKLAAPNPTANTVLNVTVTDPNPGTAYYVAFVNTGSPSGAAGADVYKITANGTQSFDSLGRVAYLFVSTLYQDVSSSVAYSWSTPVCLHSFTPQVAPAPTCAAPGVTTYTCSLCDYRYTQNLPAALGHQITQVQSTVPATCAAAGYTVYKCVRCPLTENRDNINALGHQITQVQSTVPATCAAAGYTVYKCVRCPLTENRDPINALGHSFTQVQSTVAATCATAGHTVYKCTRCPLTENRNVTNALGHSFTIVQSTVAATCATAGHTVYKCTRCPLTENRNVTNALGHSFTVEQRTAPPTYDAQGYTIYQCSRCTVTENRDFVAKLPQQRGIMGTAPKWNQGWHYILFFLFFGFIWMWF